MSPAWISTAPLHRDINTGKKIEPKETLGEYLKKRSKKEREEEKKRLKELNK